MSPEQIETLWDAFEGVDRAVGVVAYSNGYVTVPQRRALKKAVEHYRKVRDGITAPSEGAEEKK
jgi:hypothetical protein